MKVLTRANDNLKRCYNILISPKEIEEAIIEKLKETAKKVRIDGFRPGKVPLDVLTRMYRDSVRPDAISTLMSHTSKKIIQDEKLRVAFNFSNDIVSDNENGIEFTLKFELIPEIIEQDYSSIELLKYVAKITDKEVNEVLNGIRKTHKNWVDEVNNISIKEGHKVTLDLLVKTKIKNKKNSVIKDLDIVIADAGVIEDIWKPFLGCKIADVKDFVVNYPNNLRDKSLAGKSIEYSGTVKKVQKAEEYNFDDAFATSLGYENFEQLKTWAHSRAVAHYEQISKDVLKRELLEKISDSCDFQVPENMLRVELLEVTRQISEEAKKLGREMTPQILDECKKIAIKRVQLGFVVSEIAKREKIVVTRDEVSMAIKNIASMYPGHEKQIWDMYSRGDAVNVIIGPILEAKVVEFLFNKVKIKEETCSIEQLIAIDEEEFEFFRTDSADNNKNNKKKSTKPSENIETDTDDEDNNIEIGKSAPKKTRKKKD